MVCGHVVENRRVRGVFERDVLQREVSDRPDGLSVVDGCCGRVVLEFVVERTQERHRRVDGGDRGLHRLAVAERPQHDQHHGANGCEVGRIDRRDDTERPDQGEVRNPGVDSWHQLTQEGESARCGLVADDQVVDPFRRSRLHVEDVHLHAELRRLAQRGGEAHAARRRPGARSLDCSTKGPENRAEHHDGHDHGERGQRVDRDRRHDQGEQASAGANAQHQRRDERRPLSRESRQQLLQPTAPLTVLGSPRCTHERPGEIAPHVGDHRGGEFRSLPGRDDSEGQSDRDEQQGDQHCAEQCRFDAGEDAEAILVIGDRKR